MAAAELVVGGLGDTAPLGERLMLALGLGSGFTVDGAGLAVGFRLVAGG